MIFRDFDEGFERFLELVSILQNKEKNYIFFHIKAKPSAHTENISIIFRLSKMSISCEAKPAAHTENTFTIF